MLLFFQVFYFKIVRTMICIRTDVEHLIHVCFRTSRSLDLKIHVCWYWENKAHLHPDSLFRNSRPKLFLKTAEKLLQIDRRNWSKLHILPVSLLKLNHVLIFFLERFQYTFWSISLIYSITLQKDLSLQNYYRKTFS